MRPGSPAPPVIVYEVNLLLAAVSYYVIELAVFAGHGGSQLREALGRDLKGKLSPLMYLTGIALAFVTPWLAVAVFVLAALVWLVPDRRVERYLADRSEGAPA